jgi:hypothetical protein
MQIRAENACLVCITELQFARTCNKVIKCQLLLKHVVKFLVFSFC